jgi:hypothetical protein
MANQQLIEQGQAQTERAQKIADQEREHAKEALDRAYDRGEITRAQYVAEQKLINQTHAAASRAAKARSNDERRQVMKNFKTNQGLQTAQAVIEGARAAVSLIPAFAFLGPFAPVAAAAVAAPAAALQIAIIKKQKPPEFPTGGMVSNDHVAIGAQVGEAVLSRRAVAAAGGPQGVAEMNAGRGGGQGTRVVVQLGRRTLAEAVADVSGTASVDPRLGQADHGAGW